MSINDARVKFTARSGINAVVKTSGGQIQASSPVSLRTGSNRLDALDDVEESSPVNGSTLVYRASDDKYVVQQITFENVSGNLDGGTF
jgi:paraquat-inducible protein B